MTPSRLVFGSTLLFFLGLTSLVVADNTFFSLDSKMETALFMLQNDNAVTFFKIITTFGNTSFVALVTLLLTLYLYHKKKLSLLAGLLVSVLGSSLSVFILKGFIERTRPTPPFAAFLEPSFAYPSGHATIAVALYGFLAFVLLVTHAHIHYRRFIASTLVSLFFLIGFSRLYLGVHYLSDVVAGFALGTAWVIVGIHILRIKSENPFSTR